MKAHEVRAVLEGRMTQVRRLVRDQPPRATLRIDPACVCPLFPEATHHAVVPSGAPGHEACCWHIKCPFGGAGDRLWIRETWALETMPEGERIVWRADKAAAWRGEEHFYLDADYKPDWWRSPIHMPRWASRITLEVASVRVERLQDIGEADAKAEGVPARVMSTAEPLHVVELACTGRPYAAVCALQWDAVNGAGSWKGNPWVWVVRFKRVEPSNG